MVGQLTLGPSAVPNKTSSTVFTAGSFKLWFSYTQEGSGAEETVAVSPSQVSETGTVQRNLFFAGTNGLSTRVSWAYSTLQNFAVYCYLLAVKL